VQARRIIEARDHIARAADAAMRRVEADAALWRRVRGSTIPQAPQDHRGRGVGGHVDDVVEANGRELVSMQAQTQSRPTRRGSCAAVQPDLPSSALRLVERLDRSRSSVPSGHER
jgi:hypothetical protein